MFHSRSTAVSTLCVLALVGTASADLIINGNYSAGNSGFTSSYSYVTDAGPGLPNIFTESTYSVAGPDTIHPSWADFADHTGDAAGKYMVVNGWDSQTRPTSPGAAWAQTVNAGADSGMYSLSAYFAALFDQNRAGLEFRVYDLDNANALVAQSSPSFATTQPNGTWQLQSLLFAMAANTNYSVQIWDTSGIANGNDYAIDDVRLTSVVPLPPAALAGLSSLAGVGLLAAIRRKRLAKA